MNAIDGGIVQDSPQGVLIRVKVVPGASRSRILGALGDRLKVAVAAPPEGGKANAAVCDLLTQALGAARQAAAVTAGHAQPRKTVTVRGVTARDAARRLAI